MKFFKRKQKEEYEIIAQEIPLSTVYRWYLYDTELVEDINDLAELVGLSRVSEEGELKEKEDSENRVREVAPLFPFLEAISDVSAKALVALHMTSMMEEDEGLSDEELEERGNSMMSVYKAVALSTLMGAFSIGIHLGMIHANAINSDIEMLGGFDE